MTCIVGLYIREEYTRFGRCGCAIAVVTTKHYDWVCALGYRLFFNAQVVRYYQGIDCLCLDSSV